MPRTYTVKYRRTQSHAHANVRVLHHLRELLEADFPVPIFVCLHNRLVDNLLQLLILQVTAHHHLQHNEKLSIADVAITIDVVDLEGEPQLLLLVSLAAECAEA